MPKKGHRAASRQAQLQNRKRRNRGRTQIFDQGPTQSESTTPIIDPESESSQQTASSSVAVAQRASPARRQPRGSRQRSDPAAGSSIAYPHLGAELKRIGLITSAIIVILAILTVLLR